MRRPQSSSRWTVSGENAGQADRDVLGAVVAGRRVAHPLAAAHEHALAGAHVERAVLVVDVQGAGQHDGVLVEGPALAGLDPAAGRAHVRDADAVLVERRDPHVLVDELRLGPGGLDAHRG